jgi:hypothetical protein
MPRGRYRWRTELRKRLPYRPPIYQLVPKGKRDCGDHEWYLEEDGVWRCYHCRVGRHIGSRHPEGAGDESG